MAAVDKQAIPNVLYLEPNGKHSATLIFMHGLGKTAADWRPQMEELQSDPACAHIKVVMPTAPKRPFSMKWFPDTNNITTAWQDFTDMLNLVDTEFEYIEDSDQIVSQIVETEIAALPEGVARHRVMLAGFSQGGIQAIYTGYRSPHKLAGIGALSACLARKETFGSSLHENNRNTPLLLLHGKKDGAILPKHAESSHEVAKTAGVPVHLKIFEGMGHSSFGAANKDLREFVKECLPGEQHE